jgi:asparagine synthase (glutamine-hydrolysing)
MIRRTLCGIAGRVNYKTGRPVAAELVRAMTDLLSHRGPDGSGVVTRGHVGLGHRRLAIIDLSPGGAQPMSSPDAPHWITFNGEIYNYRDLRTELERQGHRFRSESDTEVILQLYGRYGPGCVDRLRGMFAFAIWDEARGELFIARDRVGKKPLFYWIDEDGLAFASEAKAFLADPGFTARPNLPAIWDYLTYQYVPAPASAFEGVSKLLPAHTLTASARGVDVRRYWSLSYAPTRQWTDNEAREAVLDELQTATTLRLISDVPVGAFLSGGIDSSLIVALMARAGAAPIRTFSIGFDEARYNELPYAKQVAERFGTDHHEFIVRPDALAILPALIWHYNEPYADASAIPTYYLARETRKHVTVALNGDGGDEAFAGYERYLASNAAAGLDWLPGLVRRGVAATASRVPVPPSRRRLSRMKRFAEAVGESPERRYARWVTHFPDRLKRQICRPEFVRATGTDSVAYLLDSYARTTAIDFVGATLDVDTQTYLPNDLLVKVDIAAMAHGLEARSPLLDHRVLELAASLPTRVKLRGIELKWMLKRLGADLLPPAILHRPKQGFGVPIDEWLRDSLRDLLHDVLFSDAARARGYFHLEAVRALVDEHVSGRRDRHPQLWSLLMLELWHQTFIDRRPVPSAGVQSLAAAGIDASR